MAKFIFSDNYNKNLERIEDYILKASDSVDAVSNFLDQHDDILRFIEQNPTTAAAHPTTGDQSWLFNDGRYRIFFKCSGAELNLASFGALNTDKYRTAILETCGLIRFEA